MKETPNCYTCRHRRNVPGDAHSACRNTTAKVVGAPHGIRRGWFAWPWNFDPVWLVSCDGWEDKTAKEATGKEEPK